MSYTANATVRRPFAYRFQCEHCGLYSDWTTIVIETGGSAEGTDQWGLEDAAAAKAWSKIHRRLDRRKGLAGKGRYPDFKGKCPYCHRHQSWEADSRIGLTMTVTAAFCLLGFILLALIMNEPLTGFVITGLVVGLIVGLILFIRNYTIKRSAEGGSMKNIPEIEWGSD